ncbi:nucleolar protein fibrillarin NOP77 (RRM superfamily) [Teratosphaeria destructans]|uniref:Nucleolar protein fibrillarin NOP77 (RRM superfamily) n=1 Tax=Teratosphaeria destructans TaxID=418781 RepID=A0A9W7SM34_9PEZI|nr:nucleolar protein fibrillarin NOP77 (RRM superfamily) [Teratosphaeria destructans]
MAPIAKKQKLSNGSIAAIEAPEAEQAQVEAVTATNDAKKDEKAVQQRRSLFVRSLPKNTTSESLTELFSDSYPIKHATAVLDPATKECRGFGFVTFADAEDAARAKTEFNGRLWQDRKLRVEIAEPRHREGGSAKEPRAKAEHEAPQPPKLIVRNLPWTIKGSNQLEKLFQSYGKIKQAYVPKKGPGLMAGFGFVIMRGRKNAEKAIEGVNGKVVDGRTLAVDWAIDKDTYMGATQDDAVKQEQDDEAESDVKGEDDDEDMEDAANGIVGEADDESWTSDADSAEEQDKSGDDDDVEVKIDGEDRDENKAERPDERSSTLFVRNLPFTCTDEDLEDHFSQFGSTRYARIVMDHATERSKGTGFVCFYNKEDADAVLRNAPRRPAPQAEKGADGQPAPASTSILQNEDADPTGQYTLDGRVLQVSRAVDKSEASRLNEEGAASRRKRNEDKRRLYLLSEGTISTKSPLWDKLSPSERTMREASAKQRKNLIEANPSLHLSLTRLSVRNIPRSIGSKELKQLAREAVVGFATDVKNGVRERISKEELARGGEEMQEAEAARRRAGKGVVRQAKVVFEGASGSKVGEESGAGRSRGYGFIEYYTHRSALMGLRWLNGHAVGYSVKEKTGKGKLSQDDIQDRKKRLIVEFAIENAQVVQRRGDREHKARERSKAVQSGEAQPLVGADGMPVKFAKDKKYEKAKFGPGYAQGKQGDKKGAAGAKAGSRKRKREGVDGTDATSGATSVAGGRGKEKKVIDEKLAKRNQIIGRKRAMRKARKGGQ